MHAEDARARSPRDEHLLLLRLHRKLRQGLQMLQTVEEAEPGERALQHLDAADVALAEERALGAGGLELTAMAWRNTSHSQTDDLNT